MGEVVGAGEDVAHCWVGGEHGDSGGDSGLGQWAGGFAVEGGRGGAGVGEPVEADVGEDVVEGEVRQWAGRVGPVVELFQDPGELADG